MPVPLDSFAKGDVYIEYAFEDVRFRVEKETGKVFSKFPGTSENEVRRDSDIFTQAILSGHEITREAYYADFPSS